MRLRHAVTVVLCLFAACTHANPDYEAPKAHHRPDRFVNLGGEPIDKPLTDLLRWWWDRWRDGLPPPPSTLVDGYRFPVVAPDLAWLHANRSQPSVTWIGHATLLVQMGGLNILTDPHFSQRAFPVQWLGPRRKTPLPAQLAQLPRIDLVAISHSHFDHLDRDTVHALIAQAGEQPVFLAPLGVHRWLRDEGATRVETFDWWQSRDVLGIKVDFVPVHHWSQRSAFDRNRTLWGGWALRAPGFSFLFVGDTGYAPVFAEIGARFGGFDLAAVPIGAYEPRWFMKDQHVDPAEAVRIHRDVRARRSVAIHWGTFELTDEPLDAPMAALPAALDAAGLPRSDFFLMHHGETRRYPFQAQAPADHPVPSTRDPKQ